jgi:hypothetical protein
MKKGKDFSILFEVGGPLVASTGTLTFGKELVKDIERYSPRTLPIYCRDLFTCIKMCGVRKKPHTSSGGPGIRTRDLHNAK